ILLVRVSVDQKIDAWHFARDPTRHVLTRNSGGHGVIARRLVETGVNRDEHDVGAGASHFVDRLPDRGYDVAEAKTSANILCIPYRHARRGRPNDPNFDSGTFD